MRRSTGMLLLPTLLAFALILTAACSRELPTTANTASSPLSTFASEQLPAQGPCGPVVQAPFTTQDGQQLGIFSTYWDDYNIYGEFQAEPGITIRRTSLGIYEQIEEVPTRPDGSVDFERLTLQSHKVPPVTRVRQRVTMDRVNDMLQEYRALPRVVLPQSGVSTQVLWAGTQIPWGGDSIARQVLVFMPLSTCVPRVTVISDLNMLDNGGLPGNAFFADLLLWMQEVPRGLPERLPRHMGEQPVFGVMFDRGRRSQCWQDGSCADTALAGLRAQYASVRDVTVSDIFSTPGSLTSIPPEVGLLFLWLPRQRYTLDEVNTLKQYVAEGGRIVVVAEENSRYNETGRATLNQLLSDLGSGARAKGGSFDCGPYRDLPMGEQILHRLTSGRFSVRVRCTGALTTTFLDFNLFHDSSRKVVTAASVAVNTTPLVAPSISEGTRP